MVVVLTAYFSHRHIYMYTYASTWVRLEMYLCDNTEDNYILESKYIMMKLLTLKNQ